MKLEKIDDHGWQRLGKFLQAHCPPSLRVKRRAEDGYGYYYSLELPTNLMGLIYTQIAEILDDEIIVKHPQYLSDIQDLVQKYEALSNREVLIRYHEDS